MDRQLPRWKQHFSLGSGVRVTQRQCAQFGFVGTVSSFSAELDVYTVKFSEEVAPLLTEQIEAADAETVLGFTREDAAIVLEAWGMLQSEAVEHSFPYPLIRLLEIGDRIKKLFPPDAG